MRAYRNSILLVIWAAFAAVSTFANVLASSEPQRVKWPNKTIRIAVSTSLLRPNVNIKANSDVEAALRRSLQKWADAADIEFLQEISDKQNVSPSGVAGDGVSLITIAQTPENVLFFLKDSETASAKTRVFYNRRGFITEADIVLNPFQQFSTDGTFGTFDLESVLTHEIGHLLGLRHSTVLGAAMLDGMGMNGIFGIREAGGRSLAESDIASIRELYGAKSGIDDCCARINGKLMGAKGRAANNISVWAEDSETGRVTAQITTANDGSFRLGGLRSGNYVLYWKALDDSVKVSYGQLGIITLEPGVSRSLNAKLVSEQSALALTQIGFNGQLSEIAVPLDAGRSYTVYLGGRNLKVKGLEIGFNSPYLSVSKNSIISHDYGSEIQIISFEVNVDPEIPAGDYSVFVTGGRGEKACLVGGLTVNRHDIASSGDKVLKN